MNDTEAEAQADGCPIQVVFGPDDIHDCRLPRGHEGSHDYTEPPGHRCTYPPDGALQPGNCRTCDTPPPDPVVSTMRDLAANFIADPALASEQAALADRLAALLRGEPAAAPPGVQRFRRRPGMVDAIQWHGEPNCAEVFAFLGWPDHDGMDEADHGVIYVPALEGPVLATPGYWIARGPEGNFWPVRADQFAATYEAACEPEQPSGAVARTVTRLTLTDALRAVLPFSVDADLADSILAALDGADRKAATHA